jgi:dipeptidyl aminopeptidase/acylaminoacyl peptidase
MPLVVSLHPWSNDCTMNQPAWNDSCAQRGWSLIQPDFRGPNTRPQACGSELAQQDVLDAVAWAKAELAGTPSRVFLTGISGGGHMSMLMAARYPAMWDAVSKWVGISDLARWYHEHVRDGVPQSYAQDIMACVGGSPGQAGADAELRKRSPLGQLAAAKDTPIDFNAGVDDGHSGSVPIHHTLKAFNEIARANGAAGVADVEIEQLTTLRRLLQPLDSDQVEDPAFGRKILLRRYAGRSRVTIFQGGHEGLSTPTFDWFDRHC